jgi:hypothetical protein
VRLVGMSAAVADKLTYGFRCMVYLENSETVPELVSLTDLARMANLDPRTTRKRLLLRRILPDALTGGPSKRIQLYSLARVWPVLARGFTPHDGRVV